MLRPSIVVLLATTFLLAGCLGPEIDPGDGVGEPRLGPLLARGTPLWDAPQDFPHPAFGWPTLTNPPSGPGVPAWWLPIPAAELPASITGLELFAEAGDALDVGAGFAVFGSLVSMPTFSGNSYILDISDPSAPKVLSEIQAVTRGAVMIPYPDGTLVTVFATSSDLRVFDITDPTDPQDLGTITPSQGSHKVGVVPGTPIVYNAASVGGGLPDAYLGAGTGVTEIYDLTDPMNPVHVQDFPNGYGCHHVYFHIDPTNDKYRATCAGIQMTQIWDIADPLNPVVIGEATMPLGDPFPPFAVAPAMLSHFAILSNDGSVLIVGDETGGGAAPGCDVYLDLAGQTLSGPIGNLWFYDISDESNPVLQGWMSPMQHYPSNPPMPGQGPEFVPGVEFPAGCTAHHGRLVPDPEGRDLLAMAFYGAGVVLIDFTDPSNPRIIDQWNPNTNTWEVWYYNGYLITGDLSRGLDILRFT